MISKDDYSENINKDIIVDYYITQNHTRAETAERFGVTVRQLVQLLESLSIVKLTYDELYNLYIIKNMSRNDIMLQYNLSKSEFDALTRKYDLHKSKDMISQVIRQTKLAKYGDANYNNRDKSKQTCLNKYGVDNPFKDVEKIKQSYLTKLGADHPMHVKSIADKVVAQHDYVKSISKAHNTYKLKTGFDNPSKNPEVIAKIQSTFKVKYGGHIATSPIITAKKSEHLHNIVTADGTALDSKWEKLVYDFCMRNKLSIERNIPITFEYKGHSHTTLIDFRIDGILFEVKGGHLLNGCYDYKSLVPISKKLEVYKENHVILITNNSEIFGKPNSSVSNGLRYSNKCKYPLIGVDIKLFDKPLFPYSSNKPKCYYDVRVNGEMSSYDAFNDESIRWKMIKNRIEYSGGFIDSRQVLTALNVTRTCKQPSWFSTKLAKYIIQKYVTTDVVVDPFAGWGARYDACAELGKQYIGSDLNKELVEWHKSVGRNIDYADANSFTYNGVCSVFICPPYQDVEVYFNSQDVLTTQCQWLERIMHNIPNAKEYVMVCKVIDSGWEKYVVETIENKSHFGLNKEYIIKLDNNNQNQF